MADLIRSWTAVVKGAVLAGLSVGMSCPPPVKGCLYNFGLVITERFVSYKHKKEDYFHDGLDGIPKAKNQIHWLISKGDLIRPERATKATYNFARHFQKKDIKAFSLVFVVNSEDRAPTRKGDAAAGRSSFERFLRAVWIRNVWSLT